MKEILQQIFPSLHLWKLGSAKEYLVFCLLLFSGFLLFHFWIRRIKRARTPEGAEKRVKKAVRSAAKRKCRFYHPISPVAGSFLWVQLSRDFLLLRIIPQGIRIYCSDHDERWQLFDNSSKETMDNPLSMLEKQQEEVEKRFKAAKLSGFHFHTFAVFADNYAEPEFHLDPETQTRVFSVRTLAAWIKKRELDPLPEKKTATVRKALEELAKPLN